MSTKEKIQQIVELQLNGVTIKEISERLEISEQEVEEITDKYLEEYLE